MKTLTKLLKTLKRTEAILASPTASEKNCFTAQQIREEALASVRQNIAKCEACIRAKREIESMAS